jgi:hypothetical protein
MVMSDIQLLTFGSGVSFIAIAAAYVYLRERYLASHRAARARSRRAQARRRRVEHPV